MEREFENENEKELDGLEVEKQVEVSEVSALADAFVDTQEAESEEEENSNMQANEVKPQKRAFDEIDKSLIFEGKQRFRSFFFKGYKDYEIFVRAWDNISHPKGVVLLAHGMVEHGLRYDDFGRFLNGRGYILIVPDCRGHGRTAGAPDMVSVYEGDLFGDVVRDNMKLADALINMYKLPLVLMGHSFGSFITQSVIQNYHKHSAVILMGSSCFKGRMDTKAGKMVASVTRAFKGKNAKAKMIYNMTFGDYSKGKEEGNWLSHDMQVFHDYNLDPYCGVVCTAQFYHSFFGGLNKLYKSSGLKMIDKDVPMLITSGAQDPVGGKKHKMIDKLPKLFRDNKVRDITYKLWDNGYHEILNETFKEDVYQYIADWIDYKLEPRGE